MKVSHPYLDLSEVAAEVLGHPFGEGGDEHPFAARDDGSDLGQQIVDLVGGGLHYNLGVEQPCRANELLHELALGLLVLVGAGGRRHEDYLPDALLELLEGERTVVERRGQPETKIHQRLFARTITVEHAANLRHGDVGLVDDAQEVVRKVVEEGWRRFAGQAAGEVPRVVLDALAVSELGEHLDIEEGALRQTLRLEQLAVGVELDEALVELRADALDGLEEL